MGPLSGLQSVDLQAAAPHPPALLLPIPAPPGSHRNPRPPFGLLLRRGGRAARCTARSVHQGATAHRTSEAGVGGQGRQGREGTLPFLLFPKSQVRSHVSSPLALRSPRSGLSRALPPANGKMAVDCSTFPGWRGKPRGGHITGNPAVSPAWINEWADGLATSVYKCHF